MLYNMGVSLVRTCYLGGIYESISRFNFFLPWILKRFCTFACYNDFFLGCLFAIIQIWEKESRESGNRGVGDEKLLYYKLSNLLIYKWWRNYLLHRHFSLGYFVSTLSPSVQIASALGPSLMLPLLLFGGFFLKDEWVWKTIFLTTEAAALEWNTFYNA